MRAILLLALLVGCSSAIEKEEPWYNSSTFRGWFGDYDDIENLGVPDERRRAQLVEQGHYLVNYVAACGVCHAADPANPQSALSGGRLMYDRFGEVRAPNITPDVETGIGDWNIAEVGRALRSSIGKNGVPISIDLHASYRWMSNADLIAISSYLLSQKPVSSKVEKRLLGGFERNKYGLFPQHKEARGYVPELINAKEKDRGLYFSHSVAGCKSCHTIEGGIDAEEDELFAGDGDDEEGAFSRFTSDLGAVVRLFSLNLKGSEVEQEAEVEGLLSEEEQPVEEEVVVEIAEEREFPLLGPNLRSGEYGGLREWNVQEIVEYLNHGLRAGREKSDAAFCPWPYYQGMNTKDKLSIAVYLKSLS